MIPQLPSYRPFGQPAVAYVDILKMPTAGDKITLNGTDIVFGTDIFGVGQTPFKVAQAFAEQIRGEVNNDGHNSRTFVGLVTAVAYGSVNGVQTARLVLIATEPGTAGNALTLTTSNAAVFAVSGATFSGGTGGGVNASGYLGTQDNGAGWTTAYGIAGVRFTSADQSGGVASVTSAPTTGQKLVITDIEVSVDTAMRVDFKEETSGTVILTIYMAANSTVALCTRSKRKLATANKKLQVVTSAAGNISVGAFYYSEA